MMNKKIIGVMALALVMIVGACPAFAATSSDSHQQVTVTVDDTVAIAATWMGEANANKTIALGNLAADGLQTKFTGGVTGEQIWTYSNVNIDVYTRASDDLKSGSDTIALGNFLYDGGDVSTAKAFKTTYDKMYTNWDKAPLGGSNNANINLYLTVPVGTAPGTYSNTVYFSAVKTTSPAPATPSTP